MACLMLLPSLSALSQTKTPQQELDSAVVLSAQQTDVLSALPREHLHSTMIGVGTSNVLDTYWDLLTGKEMCEHDAKMMVEEMVYDHFADEKRYYEEICEELDMEN